MTAVPPPVPPEIVRRAAETIRSQHWDGTGCGTHGTSACSRCYGPSPADADEVAYDVLAAVYGDIVEAARRPLLADVERIGSAWAEVIEREQRAANAHAYDRDRAVEAARRDALESAARVIGDEAAADGVYGTDIQSGLLRAGRIVWTMARDGLNATAPDQQPESAPAPVRDSEGPQIAAEGRDDD